MVMIHGHYTLLVITSEVCVNIVATEFFVIQDQTPTNESKGTVITLESNGSLCTLTSTSDQITLT